MPPDLVTNDSDYANFRVYGILAQHRHFHRTEHLPVSVLVVRLLEETYEDDLSGSCLVGDPMFTGQRSPSPA